MNRDPEIVPYLWLLHELSNTDKHRLLNLTTIVHNLNSVNVLYTGGMSSLSPEHFVRQITLVNDPQLEDGAEFYSFSTPEPLPEDTNVNMNVETALEIQFGDATPAAHRFRIFNTLDGMGKMVGAIRNEFIRLNPDPS